MNRNYGEGIHLFLPWNRMIVYDCRIQREDVTVYALTQGGLEVEVDLSIVYNVIKERAPDLHIRIGQDYAQKVIVPGAIFAVRGTIGNLHQSDIYNNSPIVIEKQISELLNVALKNEDSVINLHGLFIRKIQLPDKMKEAIEAKHEAEQTIYRERYNILQAYEEYKKVYLQASGIRLAQDIINDGLTEKYLRFAGIKATRELAASPNAKLVIVGGKDGLPLILNPDSMHSEDPVSTARRTELKELQQMEMPDLSVLKDRLHQIDNILTSTISGESDEVLSARPDKLLEFHSFFNTSTDLADDKDATTPTRENKDN